MPCAAKQMNCTVCSALRCLEQQNCHVAACNALSNKTAMLLRAMPHSVRTFYPMPHSVVGGPCIPCPIQWVAHAFHSIPPQLSAHCPNQPTAYAEPFSDLYLQNVLNSTGCASITNLDLSNNSLGMGSVKLLIPLLTHDPPPELHPGD